MLEALEGVSGQLYLHVMGEPLLHPELEGLLDLCAGHGREVNLTTNGTLLAKRAELLLGARALRQVNVSLHAQTDSEALSVLEAAKAFIGSPGRRVMVSLRLWSGQDAPETAFLRDAVLRRFPDATPQTRRGAPAWRLTDGAHLELAQRFDWPDQALSYGKTGFCRGLRDQMAVLSDGTVCPCCLDRRGDISLGNLLRTPLAEILASARARALYDGFSARVAVERLCVGCSYKERFGSNGCGG